MRRPSRAGAAAGPLTPVEFHILLSLADGERHGYAILQDVSQRTDDQLRLRTGTLYTVIKRMLDSRWIEDTDSPVGDDERRKYYRLTDAGRHELATLTADWFAFADAMARLLGQGRTR